MFMEQNFYRYLIKNRDNISEIINGLEENLGVLDFDLSFAVCELKKAVLHIHSKIISMPSSYTVEKTDDNPNQGQLFNDNGYVAIPPAATQEALATQPVEVKIKEQEPCPTKEQLIFMAKEFAKRNSADKLIEILGDFNAKNIGEICLMDDQVIRDFAALIRV